MDIIGNNPTGLFYNRPLNLFLFRGSWLNLLKIRYLAFAGDCHLYINSVPSTFIGTMKVWSDQYVPPITLQGDCRWVLPMTWRSRWRLNMEAGRLQKEGKYVQSWCKWEYDGLESHAHLYCDCISLWSHSLACPFNLEKNITISSWFGQLSLWGRAFHQR